MKYLPTKFDLDWCYSFWVIRAKQCTDRQTDRRTDRNKLITITLSYHRALNIWISIKNLDQIHAVIFIVAIQSNQTFMALNLAYFHILGRCCFNCTHSRDNVYQVFSSYLYLWHLSLPQNRTVVLIQILTYSSGLCWLIKLHRGI